ncbi:MAG: hypothetical protein HY240_10465 [Actinobacteria bacterium]|nr:hypothetical protein [Actinomycetota bacterium]
MLGSGDGGDEVSELAGTFDQVTVGIRALMSAAMEGADPESVRVGFEALRDQWLAAERDSRDDEPGSIRRFEGVAAMLCGEAFWPAIRAVSEHRDAGEELDRAKEAARWILRAHTAFASGHQEALNLCLRRAANVVRDAEGERSPDA